MVSIRLAVRQNRTEYRVVYALTNKQQKMEINNPKILSEVTKQFHLYQQALIDNDVEVLNKLFWDKSLTVRFGISENQYGHADISNYRKKLRKPIIKQYIQQCIITTYGSDSATTNIDFKREGLNGRQSQTWIRMPEGWRIVAAHVSFMHEPK